MRFLLVPTLENFSGSIPAYIHMMFGAVQLGVLAACIVLFVPMGMAGWHLSRNKVLFFSGALFITLAVTVHLTPYFPFLSTLFTQPSSSFTSNTIVSPPNRDSCISLLHEVAYLFGGNHENVNITWKWNESEESIQDCDFQKLSKLDASDLLNGSWVVVAGDSQARLVVVSLLELVLGSDKVEDVRADLFKRHSNYRIVVDEIGMKLDFIWAPYVSNLSDLVVDFKETRNYPDVLIMGAGLWDILHVNNVTDYGLSLRALRDLVVSILPVSRRISNTHEDDDGQGAVMVSESIRSPHLFWLGMPLLVNEMLNTEQKRERMTDEILDAYRGELYSNKVLRQSGGPLLLLDVHSLSEKCGMKCTADGMHYNVVVYEAAVHVMLNALLIESHQRLR